MLLGGATRCVIFKQKKSFFVKSFSGVQLGCWLCIALKVNTAQSNPMLMMSSS